MQAEPTGLEYVYKPRGCQADASMSEARRQRPRNAGGEPVLFVPFPIAVLPSLVTLLAMLDLVSIIRLKAHGDGKHPWQNPYSWPAVDPTVAR